MADSIGRVFLVGAGPGASDLITVRGAAILRDAEVIIYDNLVSPELLRLAPANAELIDAGKRGGGPKKFAQDAINELLIDRARAGQRVVRLKGGDPFIFGRGGEEAEALAAAQIAFEIVPGITSAIAAPAFAGIPLTHREYGSFVAFVPGHRDASPDSPGRVPWGDLARATQCGGTIVILMGAVGMRQTLAELTAAGLNPGTPAAAIQWATTASQKTVSADLATLADEAERARLGAPAVIVIGECARLREKLAWFERMPLAGRRIVVTRAADQSSGFAGRLRLLGAEVLEFPTIAMSAPGSYAALDRALHDAGSFDWIIFTSARGVDAVVERLQVLGQDIRSLGGARIAAIGPATAERLRSYALVVTAVPAEYRAEAIVEAIGDARIAGARILIPRAEVAREVLPELLHDHCAREVIVAPAYRTVPPADADGSRIRALASMGAVDLVTFTSSSTVRNFCKLVGRKAGLKAAAIGPITAKTAHEAGFEVVVTAPHYTTAALTDAIAAYFVARKGNP
jgi:uroporphyrinogen III methyltransferase/synthase